MFEPLFYCLHIGTGSPHRNNIRYPDHPPLIDDTPKQANSGTPCTKTYRICTIFHIIFYIYLIYSLNIGCCIEFWVIVRWLLLAFPLKAAREGFFFAKPFSFGLVSKKKRLAFNEYKNSRSGSELPEPDCFFLFVLRWKHAFSLLMHRQRKSWQKENRMKTGCFWRKSYQKPTHITQNSMQLPILRLYIS